MVVTRQLMDNYQLALIKTALAITLWALSFIFIKIALMEVSVISLITIRFGIGAVILVCASGINRHFSAFKLSDLPRMAIIGIVGITSQQLLQVSGQVTADAGVAAFLASTAPAFLVILAAIFLRESISIMQVLGVLLATLGAGFVSLEGGWGELAQGRMINPGNLLVLASAVMWAVFTILNRRLSQGRPPILIAGGMLIFGFLFLLPVFVFQGSWGEFSNLSGSVWFALFFVGVLSTAAAYLLYTQALAMVEASRLAAIQNIEPVIAVSAAAMILQEAITGVLLIGGGAILAGVYMAEHFAPGRKQMIVKVSLNKIT